MTVPATVPAPPPAAPAANFECQETLPAPPPARDGKPLQQKKEAATVSKYKAKDLIEVWSNSHKQWCSGTVEAVDGSKVHVKYASPDGAAMTKQMPESHEHLRHAQDMSCSSMMVPQPGVYNVGDQIQIWSNSQHAWCEGRVEQIEGDLVNVKYASLDGQSMTKKMPKANEYLRHAGQMLPPPSPPLGQGVGHELYGEGDLLQPHHEADDNDFSSSAMASTRHPGGNAMASHQAPHLVAKVYNDSKKRPEEGEVFVAETTAWGAGSGSMGLCGMPVKATKKATPLNPDGSPVARCPDRDRCCRCSMPVGSYFDHTCPQCEGIICLACLDDVKFILSSYRCPHCGDQKHNQEPLNNSIWYLNVYRSAQKAVAAVPILAAGLFGFGPEGNAKRTSKQACVEEDNTAMQSQHHGPPPAVATQQKKAAAAVKGPPPPPPRPKPKAGAAPQASQDRPEYTTQPPPGWEEGAAGWAGAPTSAKTPAARTGGPPPPPPRPRQSAASGARGSNPFESAGGKSEFSTQLPANFSPMR
jgi:hypothetical protein